MATAASLPAWQPLTFGGVASFAGATFTRLWIVQLAVSLLVAGSVIWLLGSGWFPVIAKAIDTLPEQAVIRNRHLAWPGPASVSLAENSFLSMRVNLATSFPDGPTADVQVVLSGGELKIASLLGFVEVSYPVGWTVLLNRADAQAWWEAWRVFVLAGVGFATVATLFLSWTMLAFIYCLPARMIAFYLDRSVTLRGCWRLAGAAVLPGAIIMSGAILLYSSRRLDLVGVLFAWLLHILAGWVYLTCSLAWLPRLEKPRPGRNPFRSNTTSM